MFNIANKVPTVVLFRIDFDGQKMNFAIHYIVDSAIKGSNTWAVGYTVENCSEEFICGILKLCGVTWFGRK